MYTDNMVDQEAVKAEVQNQLKALGLLGDEDAPKSQPIVML
jgi:hypothetical protein